MKAVCPDEGFRLQVTPCGVGEDVTRFTDTGPLHAKDDPTATLYDTDAPGATVCVVGVAVSVKSKLGISG